MAAMGTAAGPAAGGERPDTIEETRLARAAAAGDGAAFATLYDRYEGRIFNYCHRVLGVRDDAADAAQEAFLEVLVRLPTLEGHELDVSADLFTAARTASDDMVGKRKRAEPTDDLAEPSGARDPGDVYTDPERAARLSSLQDDVREANGRLPERQREVLALRELEELSYDEIAEIMGMSRSAVAQLVSRARIKLRDELRGSDLASVAASSPGCERALPLIAARQDGQLDDAAERAWLAAHLGACDGCRVAQEASQEAGISYRAWLPIVPVGWLRQATVAKAAKLAGADWSNIAHERPRHANGHDGGIERAGVGATTAVPAAQGAPLEEAGVAASRHRRLLAGGLLALFLLLGFCTAVAVGTDGTPQKLFDATGTLTYSAPATAATTTGAVASHARRKTTTSATAGASSSSASSQTTTTDQGSGNPPNEPRDRSRNNTGGGGNSVGGVELGAFS
jgi:RNA polymerase sigma-70 factor (ECF subfamily)